MKRHKLMVISQVPGFQAKQYFEKHWAKETRAQCVSPRASFIPRPGHQV